MRSKKTWRIVVGVFFILAGIMHFVKPALYLGIMPHYLPHPLALVYISGFFESLGGLGLLIPPVRRAAGIGLILLLIAVFPANLQMLQDYWQTHPFDFWTAVLILRLPLQYVAIVVVNRLSAIDITNGNGVEKITPPRVSP